jgi:hypothetical protein
MIGLKCEQIVNTAKEQTLYCPHNLKVTKAVKDRLKPYIIPMSNFFLPSLLKSITNQEIFLTFATLFLKKREKLFNIRIFLNAKTKNYL